MPRAEIAASGFGTKFGTAVGLPAAHYCIGGWTVLTCQYYAIDAACAVKINLSFELII